MTKHPAARRVHRTAHDEDAFLTGVLGTSTWARQNSTAIVIAAVAAVILIVATVFVSRSRVQTREAGALELDRVRATVQSGNVPVAKQDLQNYLSRFGKTPSGREARLMLGQLQVQSGHPDSAIALLRPLANDVESPDGYNAALLLASAYELAKQNDEADRTYLRAANGARFEYQTREALDYAARLRADAGNKAGAIELYERILTTFDPNDVSQLSEKNQYEMRLAELRASTPEAAGRS